MSRSGYLLVRPSHQATAVASASARGPDPLEPTALDPDADAPPPTRALTHPRPRAAQPPEEAREPGSAPPPTAYAPPPPPPMGGERGQQGPAAVAARAAAAMSSGSAVVPSRPAARRSAWGYAVRKRSKSGSAESAIPSSTINACVHRTWCVLGRFLLAGNARQNGLPLWLVLDW